MLLRRNHFKMVLKDPMDVYRYTGAQDCVSEMLNWALFTGVIQGIRSVDIDFGIIEGMHTVDIAKAMASYKEAFEPLNLSLSMVVHPGRHYFRRSLPGIFRQLIREKFSLDVNRVPPATIRSELQKFAEDTRPTGRYADEFDEVFDAHMRELEEVLTCLEGARSVGARRG